LLKGVVIHDGVISLVRDYFCQKWCYLWSVVTPCFLTGWIYPYGRRRRTLRRFRRVQYDGWEKVTVIAFPAVSLIWGYLNLSQMNDPGVSTKIVKIPDRVS
jgi:hypothetical protein